MAKKIRNILHLELNGSDGGVLTTQSAAPVRNSQLTMTESTQIAMKMEGTLKEGCSSVQEERVPTSLKRRLF